MDLPNDLQDSAANFAFARALLNPDEPDLHRGLQEQLEANAEELRLAILRCRPRSLLGYFWGQLAMSFMPDDAEAPARDRTSLETVSFALEYCHATFSAHAETAHGTSQTTEDLERVSELAESLHSRSLMYCMSAAMQVDDDLLGPDTRDIAMHALTSWVALRGRRYQVLEREFLAYALQPHDAALRQAYGIGADDIAQGVQQAVNATISGHTIAAHAIGEQAEFAEAYAADHGIDVHEVMSRLEEIAPQRFKLLNDATEAMLDGGLCKLDITSGLPSALLDDMSYVPGEESDFFAPGALAGTPLRRLPGRVKPLVALGGAHYACDPNFLRDSAYRAVQWGLLRRLPEYRDEWGQRQAAMTERAFSSICSAQLEGAEVFRSIYYPNPDREGDWAESDVLILLDDVMLQVEAKAGVMPMHSPELNFNAHVRSIKDLVLKAHAQCDRFLRYLASADSVPIFELVNGAYRELRRVRLASYRQVVPIGLTVEAFTPFSAMCKTLDATAPILGKHAFISMSVDDLFVLTRFLPSAGELTHYLSVRQGLAKQPRAVVYDELDHLGLYVQGNRVDWRVESDMNPRADLVWMVGGSDPIDNFFSDPDWQQKQPLRRKLPTIVTELLRANEANRTARHLWADTTIRDFADDLMEQFEQLMTRMLPTLNEVPARYSRHTSSEPMLFVLQREDHTDFVGAWRTKAKELAGSVGAATCKVLLVRVNLQLRPSSAWVSDVAA